MKLFKSDKNGKELEESKKRAVNINIILLIAVILINAVSYSFLPEYMTSHMGLNGKFTGHTSKNIFIFVVPILTGFFTVYSFFTKKKDSYQLIFANVILLLVDLLFIFKNLAWF